MIERLTYHNKRFIKRRIIFTIIWFSFCLCLFTLIFLLHILSIFLALSYCLDKSLCCKVHAFISWLQEMANLLLSMFFSLSFDLKPRSLFFKRLSFGINLIWKAGIFLIILAQHRTQSLSSLGKENITLSCMYCIQQASSILDFSWIHSGKLFDWWGRICTDKLFWWSRSF